MGVRARTEAELAELCRKIMSQTELAGSRLWNRCGTCGTGADRENTMPEVTSWNTDEVLTPSFEMCSSGAKFPSQLPRGSAGSTTFSLLDTDATIRCLHAPA